MRIVIALGGNALLRRSDPMTTEVQRRNIMVAAQAIAPLAAEHSVVVVHGNGPQVGLLSLQAGRDRLAGRHRRDRDGKGRHERGRAGRPRARARPGEGIAAVQPAPSPAATAA